MSQLFTLANQLRVDIELYYVLLEDAIRHKDVRLQRELTVELAEMKDMLQHIEQPEIHRHLRLVANEAF